MPEPPPRTQTARPAPAPALPPVPAVQAPPRVETAPLPELPIPGTAPTAQAPETAPPPAGTPKAAEAEVRAALLLPLTGTYAAFGQTLSNAAQLAMFEVADQRFNLIPLDTKGTAEGAAAAAKQALAQGADIILGPVFSPEVKAAAPLAREHGVPMLAFTTDRTAAGQGVYALGFLPGGQVERVFAYARSQGRQRFAVLAPNTDYGRAVAEAARAAASAAGAELVRAEYYDPAASEFTGPVKRFASVDTRARALQRERDALKARGDDESRAALKAMGNAQTKGDAPFDAVLLPDDGVRLKTIASLLAYYDAEGIKLLGTMLWDDGRASGEPALVGAWYPAPAKDTHAQLEQRYEKAFGPVAPRVAGLVGIGYDATALAAALARQGFGHYPAAALQNPNGFAGVDGIFRLNPDGTAERGLAVREITADGSREVSPAPASFAPVSSAQISPATQPSPR
jgi:ABC-type branched-subunit amino acid transport system substrate-binding protein